MKFNEIYEYVGEETFSRALEMKIKIDEELVENNFSYIKETKADLIDTLLAANQRDDIYNVLTSRELQKKIEICDLLGIQGTSRSGLMQSFSFGLLMQSDFSPHLLEFFIEKLGVEVLREIITLDGVEGNLDFGFIDLEKLLVAERLRNQLIHLCHFTGVPGGYRNMLLTEFFEEKGTKEKKEQISFIGGCFRELRYMVEVLEVPIYDLLKYPSEDIVQYCGLLRALGNEFTMITGRGKSIDSDFRGSEFPYTIQEITHPYIILGELKKSQHNESIYRELITFLRDINLISADTFENTQYVFDVSYPTTSEIPSKDVIAKLPFSTPLGVYDKKGLEAIALMDHMSRRLPEELTYSRHLYKCVLKIQAYLTQYNSHTDELQKVWYQTSKWSIPQQIAFFNLVDTLKHDELDFFFAYRKVQGNKQRRESIESILGILQLIDAADASLQQLANPKAVENRQNRALLQRFVIQYGNDGEGTIRLNGEDEPEIPSIISNILSEIPEHLDITPSELVKDLDSYYEKDLAQSIDNVLSITSTSHREFMHGEHDMLYKFFMEIKKDTPAKRAKLGLIMEAYKHGKRDTLRSNISCFPLEFYLTEHGDEVIRGAQVEKKHAKIIVLEDGTIEEKTDDEILLEDFAVDGIDNEIRENIQSPQQFTRNIEPLTYEQQWFNIKSGFEELRDPDIYDVSIQEQLTHAKKNAKNFGQIVKNLRRTIENNELEKILPIIKFAARMDDMVKNMPSGEIEEKDHTEKLLEAQKLLKEIYAMFTGSGYIPGMIRCEEYANHFGLDFDEGTVKILSQSHIRQPIETQTNLTNDLCTVLKHMRGCIGLKGGNAVVNMDYLLPNRFFLYSQNTADAESSLADQILTILPTAEHGPMFVLDTLYGLRNKDILVNHIMTTYNQAKDIAKHITLPIFIPYSTITSAGTNEKELVETLKKHIPAENIKKEIIPTIDLTYAGYKEFDVKKGGILISV